MVPIHRAEVKNGVIRLLDKPRFDEWVKSLSGIVEVVVRPPRKPRSNSENRYYWGVIIKLISDHTGSWPEDIHYEFKRRFLRVGGDDRFPVLRSTTELSTTEAEDYYTKCRVYASSELGILIPLPNEIEGYASK